MDEHNIDSRTAPSVSPQNADSAEELARTLCDLKHCSAHIAEHGCADPGVRAWARDGIAEHVLWLIDGK
jgi:hypothetical protein